MITKDDLILDVDVDRGVTIPQLICICSIVKEFKPEAILEIGTMHGRTTINMARFAPENTVIDSVDIRLQDLRKLDKYPERDKIRFVQADSCTFQFNRFDMYDYDLIFIDGDHSLEGAKSDTKLAMGLVYDPLDSIIIWHDYGNAEETTNIRVKRALDEMGITPDLVLANRLGVACQDPAKIAWMIEHLSEY